MSKTIRLALDATYAAYPERTGIGIYSEKLIASLARNFSPEARARCELVLGFRPGPYLRWARKGSWPAPFQIAPYLDPWVRCPAAKVFHGLNQRLPEKRYELEIATLHEHFPALSDRHSTLEFQRHLSRQIRHALGEADRIIAVSESARNHLVQHEPLLASKIRVVHHGVESAQAVPAQEAREFCEKELRLSPGESFFLNVGAVQTRKNIGSIALALKSLPQYRLVVAGADGYGAEDVRDLIRKEGLRERVQFLGHSSQKTLAYLYSAAVALVFPSFEEAFGMPILEAMSYGLPVITSNLTAMPEVAGDAALLVDPHSVEAIREAMRRIVEDSALAGELRRKGLERAAQFSWDACATKTWDVYHELLQDLI